MTILITGASTDLGRSLADRLMAEGRDVRLLTRHPFSTVGAFGPSVSCHEWHPLSEPLPKGILDGVSTVVHLMGEPFDGRLTPPKAERLGSLRRTAADKIISGLPDAGVRLILASTAGIYPDDTGGVLTEANATAQPRSVLQAAAHQWEAAAGAARTAGGRVAIVRFGLLVGADRMLEDLARWIGSGVAPVTTGAIVPLIDLDDAVALLVGLIDNPEIDGPINAVAPVPVTTERLVKCLADAMGGARLRVRLPARMTVRLFGAGAELLLRRSQVVPRRLMELGCEFTQPDATSNLARVVDAVWERRVQHPSSFDYVRAAFHGIARPVRING